ncbi:G2E3 ligase, partial [Rhinopomastus cyanomelas]|nr:G2E3 ligase [Rhinopomastus cyanomelas]
QDCFVCGENGASITCQEMGCERSFHFPCAMEGSCITQFVEPYRSYCWEHRPEQLVEAVSESTNCLISMDPVEDRVSYGTMAYPACKHAWFHQGCIQEQARQVGTSCFQCPLCHDQQLFVKNMLIMGIRIPSRPPVWENLDLYAPLLERHSHCDASECLCPLGREWREAVSEGTWQLLLCSSCASEGIHWICAGLDTSTASWECGSCAGPSTGERE